MNRAEQIKAISFDAEEWEKLFYKYQQEYIRKRLKAIKYLYEGQTRQEVMTKVGCARKSLIIWIDIYCEKGLKALATPMKSHRTQKLGSEEKGDLKKMLLEKKPTDYGIDRQIWTGKSIIEVVNQRWNIQLKDSRIYDILKRLDYHIKKSIVITRMQINKLSKS
jgi:transposase